MTGATPQGQGEQTQPMAIPPWPEVAGGWPSGRTDRGPYADADTIDELDAVVASQTGAEAGQGPPGAGSGVAVAALAGVDWPDAARRPGGPLLAWLWGEQGQAGEYLLASNSVTVGRDPGSDVVLPEPSVSHAHAKIEYCEGQWWLQSADSAGPTWVNGQPVEPGQRVPVTDGDRLRFGFHTQFRLLVPSAR
jgi:FHA domain